MSEIGATAGRDAALADTSVKERGPVLFASEKTSFAKTDLELVSFIGYPRSLNALRCVTEATSQ